MFKIKKMNLIHKLLFFIFSFLFSISANAQLAYLRLSPTQKIEQKVGVTDVTLEFSRPQMKGRKVFGALVPFDKMWRTGANENTKLTFSYKVNIGEKDIPSGTYTLLTKPSKKQWEIYLYTETNNLDVPNPIDTTKLIYLTTVKSETLEKTEETLVINFYDITETTANLGISWENTSVRFPITFYTREAMEVAIDREFKQNAMDFAIAAAYYYQRDIELEKAKKLQELSIELREKPSAWAYNDYALILYKLKEKENAIEALKYSLELAEASNNQYLIKENKRLLSEWQD